MRWRGQGLKCRSGKAPEGNAALRRPVKVAWGNLGGQSPWSLAPHLSISTSPRCPPFPGLCLQIKHDVRNEWLRTGSHLALFVVPHFALVMFGGAQGRGELAKSLAIVLPLPVCYLSGWSWGRGFESPTRDDLSLRCNAPGPT